MTENTVLMYLYVKLNNKYKKLLNLVKILLFYLLLYFLNYKFKTSIKHL